MLRHACGYALANKGHDTRALQAYLGHRTFSYRALHGDVADAVQGFLAGVNRNVDVECTAGQKVAALLLASATEIAGTANSL
jgi:hypothetical protein